MRVCASSALMRVTFIDERSITMVLSIDLLVDCKAVLQIINLLA